MDETLSERSGEEADLFSYRAPVLDTEDDGITGEAFIRRLLESGAPAYNINFLLRLEAYSLQLAYSHNKILSLSNSRTRILAHQVESTHRVMSALNQRFLIADEVGLGKTI